MHCTEIFNLIFAENLASSFLEKCYYLEEMVLPYIDLVLPGRWYYLRSGTTWKMALPKRWYYRREMVLSERWYYLRSGITWNMVLPERWYYLRDGIIWEMILPEKWYYLRNGITWKMVLHERLYIKNSNRKYKKLLCDTQKSRPFVFRKKINIVIEISSSKLVLKLFSRTCLPY